MATIDDFGGNTDPLNAPALGGASGWAAAVRDYLKDLMSRKVEKTGDTMTGDLSIYRTSSASSLSIFSGSSSTNIDTRVTVGNESARNAYVDSVRRWKESMSQNAFSITAADDAGALSKTALSIARATGLVTLYGDPTAALGVATKQYVDAIAASKVSKSGDTMTGRLLNNHSVAIGDGWSGATIAPAGQNGLKLLDWDLVNPATITVDTPTAAGHAATKGYVDSKGTWQDYSPTVLQGNTVTYTRTQARYTRVGNIVTVECRLEITGTGTASQAVSVSMPLSMFTASGTTIGVGRVNIEGKQLVSAVVADAGSQLVSFKHMPDTASNFGVGYGSGSSAALASGNQIVFTCTYETDAA